MSNFQQVLKGEQTGQGSQGSNFTENIKLANDSSLARSTSQANFKPSRQNLNLSEPMLTKQFKEDESCAHPDGARQQTIFRQSVAPGAVEEQQQNLSSEAEDSQKKL
jgi:hypothetical protein